jgi:hypothetical protein
VISITENSNKFQKTRFEKEKSVEDVVTLGPMAPATLFFIRFRLPIKIIKHLYFLIATYLYQLYSNETFEIEKYELVFCM